MDQTGLLVLGEGTGDLAHHLATGIVACRQIVAVSRQEPNAAIDEAATPSSCAISSRAKREAVLDYDRAHPVALDAVEQRGEAGPILDRVRSTNRRIVKLCHDLEAATSAL